MPEYCLSPIETLVARAWRDGEGCDLGAEPENVLRGEALVRILLGRRVRLTGEDEPTAAPSPSRWRQASRSLCRRGPESRRRRRIRRRPTSSD
jgi:hypothetical protein